MKLVSILFALVITLIVTLRTAGQEDCTFDVESIKALLEDAQTAYDEGDTEAAFEQIAKAEAELKALRVKCGVVTLTENLDVMGGMFSFAYPEGWAVDIQESGSPQQPAIVLLSSSAEALENLDESVPGLKPGEQATGLLFIQPEALPSLFNQDTEFENSAEGIAIALSQQMTEGFEFEDPETLSINDRRAAKLNFSGGSFEAIAYVVEFKREQVYAVLIALAAPGEGALIENLALEMAQTVRYDSSIVPKPPFVPSPVPFLTPTP